MMFCAHRLPKETIGNLQAWLNINQEHTETEQRVIYEELLHIKFRFKKSKHLDEVGHRLPMGRAWHSVLRPQTEQNTNPKSCSKMRMIIGKLQHFLFYHISSIYQQQRKCQSPRIVIKRLLFSLNFSPVEKLQTAARETLKQDHFSVSNKTCSFSLSIC